MRVDFGALLRRLWDAVVSKDKPRVKKVIKELERCVPPPKLQGAAIGR